jgi:cell division protein FtsI/penicillin-binding protein 2
VKRLRREKSGSPSRLRRRLVVAVMGLFAVVVVTRLVYLQILVADDLRTRVSRQHSSVERLTPRRGAVLDRDGRPFALSVTGASVGLRPSAISAGDRETVARAVANATGVSARPLLRQLRSRDRFFFAAFQADRRVGDSLGELDLPGIEIHDDWRRVYPHGSIAAHTLGFVGTEGRGLCGIEQRYEELLSGPERRVIVLRDGLRVPFRERGAERNQPPGLELTLHLRLQAAVEKALRDGVRSAAARSGVAVVMDPRDGDILAMASYPTFDLMDRSVRSPQRAWNRAVGMTFEPGSVMKVFAVAAAIEAGRIRATEVFDVGDGVMPLPGGPLRESHRDVRGRLDVTSIIARSSNVGAAKIALRLDPPELHAALRRFGFGGPTGIDLPGEEVGVLRPPSGWTARSPAMLAIGQEMSSTPLGVLRAYASLAREGRLPTPRLARAWIDPDGVRYPIASPAPRLAIDAEIARTLVGMLHEVVEEGTGRNARIAGYRVAGKTGTAQKAGPGGYPPGLYVSSFVGFGPVADPELAAIVVIDEPRDGYFASEVAAPVWTEIMETAFRMLRAPADGLLVARSSGPRAKASPVSVPPSAPAPGVSRGRGRIPDLVGLGAREAIVALATLGFRVEATGTGLVVSQSPAAGTAAAEGTLCRLTLGRPS